MNIQLYLHDSTYATYPRRTSSCAHLRLDHTSYRHHPTSWKTNTTATDFTHTFVIPTVNRHFCCICYLVFVPFIVFGCHYSHALNLNHLQGRHAYRLCNKFFRGRWNQCPLIGQWVAESLGGGIDSREKIDLWLLQISLDHTMCGMVEQEIPPPKKKLCAIPKMNWR